MKRDLKTNRGLRRAAFFSMLLAVSLLISEAGEFLAASASVTISGEDPDDNEPAAKTTSQNGAPTGSYKKTMVKSNGDYYYFLSNGKMAVNRWVKYKGKRYYFGADGKMVTNAWIGNYYVGLNGRRVKDITKKKVLRKSTKAERKAGKRLIILGASRVYHMGLHVSYDKQTVYLCRKGAGVKFLINNAGPKLCAYLAMFPHSTVVFQFGNNDLANYRKHAAKYFKYYKKLMDAFPTANFYFMDALPGKTRKKNKLRVKFNRLLRSAFPAGYIGGYDYLINTGVQFTSDGEHYKPATSYRIYDYIVQKTGWSS